MQTTVYDQLGEAEPPARLPLMHSVDDVQVVEPGRFRVKETPTHYVEVLMMIFNSRIVTTPKDEPREYDRYWCYYGDGRATAAILAAMAWDPTVDEQPVGWVKNWRGERNELPPAG